MPFIIYNKKTKMYMNPNLLPTTEWGFSKEPIKPFTRKRKSTLQHIIEKAAKECQDQYKHHAIRIKNFLKLYEGRFLEVVEISESELNPPVFQKPNNVKWVSAKSVNAMCSVCGGRMIHKSMKSLVIGNRAMTKRICAFCLKDYGELAARSLEEIPSDIRESFNKDRKVNIIMEKL